MNLQWKITHRGWSALGTSFPKLLTLAVLNPVPGWLAYALQSSKDSASVGLDLSPYISQSLDSLIVSGGLYKELLKFASSEEAIQGPSSL